MANIKISALPVATVLNDGDDFPVVQSGVTKQVSADIILDAAEARVANTFGEGLVTLPAFLNAFAQDGTTPVKVIVAGFENKAVYFRGLIDCSAVTFTPGSFVQAFRLPSNARPKVISMFPVVGLYNAIGICAVHPDGYVYFKNVTGDLTDSGLIDLANVHFYIDPF